MGITDGTVYSAPFRNVLILLEQPNGINIKCYTSGDEYYNWVHDENNYTIIKNKITGYYTYALKENDKLIPSKYIVGIDNPKESSLEVGINISTEKVKIIKRNIYLNHFQKRNNKFNKYNNAITGSLNNIVVFIRFKDEPEFNGQIANYDSMFNSASEASLYNYYSEVSYKQLNIKSYLYPLSNNKVLSCQDIHPRAYYQPFDSITNKIGYKLIDPNDLWGSERKEREMQLLYNALESIKNEIHPGINLDMDNDGNIDNICFIISGSVTAWSSLLWPHKWFMEDKEIYINNKRVHNYNFQIKDMVDIRTLSHELFHSLGAPDLYRYNDPGYTKLCGAWDIMDQGNGHMSAFMKWKYGKWIADIPEITSPGIFILNTVQLSQKCAYQVKSPYSDSEYYIIEYRKKSGLYESSLPGTGLLVYRINKNTSGNGAGPPDEVYLYRPMGIIMKHDESDRAYFNKEIGRYLFNDTTNPKPLLSNGISGGLNIIVNSPIMNNDSLSILTFNLLAPKMKSNIKNITSNISDICLDQNYPNPFNPETKIVFSIPYKSHVIMKLYDQLGREIKSILNEIKEPGKHEIIFKETNLSSGLYFYTLQVYSNKGKEGIFKTKKMIFIK